MSSNSLNPFLLAASVPDPDPRLLPLLEAHPELASQQDSHGYSLLHAAASYNHASLLRSLVQTFHVDVNLKDEDGETCLFVTETVEIAKCLVEELHIDTKIKNDEGMTAANKIESEEEFPEVLSYLRAETDNPSQNRSSETAMNANMHPPPLPPNMHVNLSTFTEDPNSATGGQEPDPEFRRRIEELAGKENFNTEEGQRELRELITDAVRGVNNDEREAQRRRVV